jgi:hypothetical protein
MPDGHSSCAVLQVNQFWEGLPRTMLLVMKCHNLLGSLGRKLAADDPVRAAAFVRR